jgi:heme exporter protein A
VDGFVKVSELTCQRDGRELFASLGFELGAGECLEVRGSNGSGKSTLLRCVAGLFADYGGSIEAIPCLYLGHKLGLNLLLSAEQNLHWYQGLRGSADPISDVLARVGMAGYERVSCQNMSAGQQRRIGLARMLVARSALWLLDEPLTALDAAGQALVASLIEAHLEENGAVLCATHQGLNVAGVRTLQLGSLSG